MNTDKVTRVEVIDWVTGGGRAYTWWEDVLAEVEAVLQDNNRTLKIFIKPRSEKP
jgi:hypothetical protein